MNVKTKRNKTCLKKKMNEINKTWEYFIEKKRIWK